MKLLFVLFLAVQSRVCTTTSIVTNVVGSFSKDFHNFIINGTNALCVLSEDIYVTTTDSTNMIEHFVDGIEAKLNEIKADISSQLSRILVTLCGPIIHLFGAANYIANVTELFENLSNETVEHLYGLVGKPAASIHYTVCGENNPATIWNHFVNLRRMRCSTNIYLTALAVADIIYLLFIFILSLEHYPNIHHSKYKIYWSTFGLSHWFCDASAYTSIYLTVSFTIERYIACCHPLIGQVLCTESRAKRVIAGVVLLCFILSISTAFEYKLVEERKYYNRSFPIASPEALCPMSVSDAFAADNFLENVTTKTTSATTLKSIPNESIDSDFVEEFVNYDDAFYEYNDDDRITKRNAKLWELNGVFYNRTEVQRICEPTIEIHADESELGRNAMYKKIFYIFISTVGTFIPLMLLATFNCFLVAAVHRSHKMRHTMTNTRQSDRSTAQENKVTVTLIAVVVLFLVCQTPSAIQLIYLMTAKEYSNVDRAINNVCNFLTTLNAACNFLLYCALSDKYRKTVKELFLGRKMRRQNTMSSTYFSRYGSNPTTGTSFYSKSPSTNVAGSTAGNNGGSIRNRALSPKKSRFSITPTDYANFQAEMAVKHAKTLSLAASDFQTEKNRQNSITVKLARERVPPVKVNASTFLSKRSY